MAKRRRPRFRKFPSGKAIPRRLRAKLQKEFTKVGRARKKKK